MCPCSPRITQSMLVECTTGVSKPLTSYRCQQGFTTSLEVGNIHFLYIHYCTQSKRLTDKMQLGQDLC